MTINSTVQEAEKIHGFQIVVPEYANTTVDNRLMSAEKSYEYYNTFIWQRRYAKCISLDEALNMMHGRIRLFNSIR